MLWNEFHHSEHNSIRNNFLMLNPAQIAHIMGVLWYNLLIVSILDGKQFCLICK